MLALGIAGFILSMWVDRGLADVAPPPEYVEKCRMSLVQKQGEECTECRAGVGQHEKCAKSLGLKGYTYNCRNYGASNWTEIWCRPVNGSSTSDTSRTGPVANSVASPPVASGSVPAQPATPGRIMSLFGKAEKKELFKKPTAASNFPFAHQNGAATSKVGTAPEENDPTSETAGRQPPGN